MPSSERASSPCWEDGWLQAARPLMSPNQGVRPAGATVDLIVLHSISLPPGLYGGHAVEQLFTNRLDWSSHPYFESIRGLAVSTHFFLRRDGSLCQFVSTDQRAWHAGVSRYRGRDNCNDHSVGVELEGLEGLSFTQAQYEVLASLCQCLQTRYPIRHIAGHSHVAPGRKFDPGPEFDWLNLKTLLPWPADHWPDLTDAKALANQENF